MNLTKIKTMLLGTMAMVAVGCSPDDGRPEYPSFDQTILELATARSDLTTWTSLVERGGLGKALGGTQATFTVFAPNDDAFAAFGSAQLEALQADPAALSSVLRFHIVGGTQKLNLVRLHDVIPTLTSTTVHVADQNGQVVLSGANGTSARFTANDVQGSNGILHVIDAVLTPFEVVNPVP